MQNPEIYSSREFVTPEQLAEWKEDYYSIESYGDSYSVIIVGEEHCIEEHQKKQIELIRQVKPEYVLDELLEGWIYNPENREFEKQENRLFGKKDENIERRTESISNKKGLFFVNPQLILTADEVGFKIIGCDFTTEEKELLKVSLKKVSSKKTRDISFLRERQMVETILEYQSKSAKPIVTIVGSNHSNNIHKNKLLQEKGFDYACVHQMKYDKTQDTK